MTNLSGSARWFVAACVICVAELASPIGAVADDRSTLEEEGWRAVGQGTVSDEFEGCDFDKPVPLDGGFIFVCSDYSYSYAYRPDFVVMERNGARKYLIDDEEFDGALYRGTVVRTYVSGDFEGCDFDKLIPFDNGLVFECAMYHYHYAYHPPVMIIKVDRGPITVTIAGDVYRGQLFKRN